MTEGNMTAKYPRIGRLTIGGVDYPAVINVRVLTALEDRGISMENVLTAEGHRWSNFATVITLAINTGLRMTGDTRTVTEDEIADAIDLADLTTVTEQLALLLGHHGRTVEAEPPKN